MNNPLKIGFGGGCHWCTEAVFKSLKGVTEVEQGFIAPKDNPKDYSEAVIVHFEEDQIRLDDLIAIHLYTHQSTKNHTLRYKYRSAVYFFGDQHEVIIIKIMKRLQKEFVEPIITKILPFGGFTSSEEKFQNYYYSDTRKPFCKTHISPKIALLMHKFSNHVRDDVK
ncbi:peptide-methionine (S)-S-oxide reductase [Maribacter sp. X9]|uniref:peptide-methionine (S)-S-oxide reductase n=1 Tax=Maribacter sp. X9 TaxID=3402159 RepID=UPI003AF3E9C5